MKQYYLSQRINGNFVKFGVVKDFEKDDGKVKIEITDEQIKDLYNHMTSGSLKRGSYNGKEYNEIYAEVWKDKANTSHAPKVASRKELPINNVKNDECPF